MANPGERTLTVFVAEDDAADLFWLEMVFKNAGFAYRLDVARDGERAREYLANQAVPDLILLDLHMPRMTALEILRDMPDSKRLPLRILTGSAAVGPSPHGYIAKPLTHAKLIDCLESFETLRPFAEQLMLRVPVEERLEKAKC